jgi:hypothetical protein
MTQVVHYSDLVKPLFAKKRLKFKKSVKIVFSVMLSIKVTRSETSKK